MKLSKGWSLLASSGAEWDRSASVAIAPRLGLGALMLATIFVALVALMPSSANATVVYRSGEDILVMNDDGSGQKVLIPRTSVPGMNVEGDTLGSPAVAAKGTKVAFAGSTERFATADHGLCGNYPYYYSCSTFHKGQFGTGLYQWEEGESKRISPDPAPCFNCTSLESNPSLSADGSRLLATLVSCQGFRDEGNFTCEGTIGFRDGGPGPSCDESFFEGRVNPANSGQYAYIGCSHPVQSELYAILVTGPGGERSVACDDAEQAGVAWSADGTQIATAEHGEQPGIWTYPSSSSDCVGGAAKQVLAVSDEVYLGSLAWTAADAIIFEADGDLYSVPATCNGCQFPASATRLTSNEESTSPSWTSQPLAAFEPEPDDKGDGPGPDKGDKNPTALEKQIAKKCGKLKGKKRKACAKRIKAIAKCKKIKGSSKQAKRKKAVCMRKAKRR